MLRSFLLSLTLSITALSAVAQADTCAKSEAACVLDAAWSAALVLPQEKQERLYDAFLEIAVMTGETEVVEKWETRFGLSARPVQPYQDYGWQKAQPILQRAGVDGLIEEISRADSDLAIGRADALLAAGRYFAPSDANAARRLFDALFGLIKPASKFERPSLAHAAAELAMVRCDAEALEKSLSYTDAPRNIRYAFWRARINGDGLSLLTRIRNIDNDQDTRDVRRVLDGYRAIIEFGYCKPEKSEIGDSAIQRISVP
ncbi:MAG: hypothetical protein AAFR51_03045 [Pseudomonadota bacterium]